MQPRVMIFGTFDHLHDGHRFLVTQAMKRGQVTAVVGRDRNVLTIKGRPPLQTLAKRMETLAAEFPTLRVIGGSEQDFLAPLRTEKPDLLLFGYDQKLPPGISYEDITCPWERAEALQPDILKSSLLSQKRREVIEKKAKK